ncbi:type 1 fimbrial protein, partial [Klebsiella pneumoniae]|nr:type 1 fimbrial protein [Klebsiella pneumoniae]
ASPDGPASLPCSARYHATAAAKAGPVAPSVTFTVVYP